MPLLEVSGTTGQNALHSGLRVGMPALNDKPARQTSAWTQSCANPNCPSGWLQLWRNRHIPRFEGEWTCSAPCMEALVANAVRRELRGKDEIAGTHAPRMPLGLILLAKGWISRQELEHAVILQRIAGRGRIGEWLRRVAGISEEMIARALAAQWSCISICGQSGVVPAPELVPAQIRESCGLLPLRHVRRGTLYLAGNQRVEHGAVAAIGRMLHAQAEPVFIEDSRWSLSFREQAVRPEMRTVAVDQTATKLLTQIIEREKPHDSRLVRVKDLFWLRTWKGSAGMGRPTEPAPQSTRDFLVPTLRQHQILGLC
jgi:hypothetical protein